ncbi:MAG: hypothetical protein F4137_02485 [Acidobacteria bacterium]|nr:hypothetical protein [Acidobacteriota bacterium]
MQSPKLCDYCRKRPADQTLFTSFMSCGEGDATKRNAHLCERCRHHAMLVLDRIGMTIAFEGDGRLRWDAHVKLSDSATRSLARRAMQREDLLLRLDEPSTAARAPEPTEPEKLSLIHQLAVEERLVESEVDRGREFWPEDPCRLTATGQQVAAFIRGHRRAEANGLSIKEWSPRYVPEQGTDEEFREYATRVVISPDGDRYDGSDHLMLRQDGDRAPSGNITSEPQTHLLFQPDLWTTRRLQPIGYFFFDAIPVIAFDADDMQVLAEHYELARAVAGADVRWTLIEPTPANPMYPNGEAARMIRANGPGTTAAAFASIFQPPGERPGIRMLRKRAR